MKAKSEIIRNFIIDKVEENPRELARIVATEFGMSRQAVNRHMKNLIEDGIIEAKGNTKDRIYTLKETVESFRLSLAEHREEDRVWDTYVANLAEPLRENVYRIVYYGFTEMFNNAIDHSGGNFAIIQIISSAKSISLKIIDDGIGIFEKIKTRFNLADHREAVLELSKGKLTTDPNNHSGQGIFFTSRMFDEFAIQADHLFFAHDKDDDDWLIETDPKTSPGTYVFMKISAFSKRTAKEVFDKYTDLDSGDYAFSKTHVPLSLAKYGGEQLVSRSQAKRVLSRFEKFKEVFLDFHGVEAIGQAFADEIFRVFRRNNPEIQIVAIRTSALVNEMISRAQSAQNAPSSPPVSQDDGMPNNA